MIITNANTQSKIAESAAASEDRSDLISDKDDNECIICFKNMEIYAIGECDHPICYICFVHMRVLNREKKCPICRHSSPKVLLTTEKLPYRELESKNQYQFIGKRYLIGFSNSTIQQKYTELLVHRCSQCDIVFSKFKQLRNHARSQHDLHYCDICTQTSKMFTFERRCYTQHEFRLHCARGDPGVTSQDGHPVCPFCEKPFIDNDKLNRHLARKHCYCVACAASGYRECFKDYDDLEKHLKSVHRLRKLGRRLLRIAYTDPDHPHYRALHHSMEYI